MKDYNGFSAAQRQKSQNWLNQQWRSGALPRPCKCIACGQDKGIIDAHAEDYSEPFAAEKTDQYHLCFRCHMMVHCRFKNPGAWHNYKFSIMQGIRFKPFYSRNFPKFKDEHLESWNPQIECEGEPPERDVLSEIVP